MDQNPPLTDTASGILPVSLPCFKALCIQFITNEYDIEVKENESLPLSSIASHDSILFKISESRTIDIFIKEIENDFKFLSRIKSFDEIIYFNPYDKFQNKSIRHNIYHSVKNPSFKPEIITYSEIISNLHSKSIYLTAEIFAKSDLVILYRDKQKNPVEQTLIIEDIFNFVFSTESQFDCNKNKTMDLSRLKQKISVNFGVPEWDRVTKFYLNIWDKKEIVEEYVIKNFESKNKHLFCLRRKIQKEFASLNWHKIFDTPVNYIGILEKIAEALLPPGKNHIPEYTGLSEAIVLYFFEYCDFGKKFINEEPSLFQKQLDEYDSQISIHNFL